MPDPETEPVLDPVGEGPAPAAKIKERLAGYLMSDILRAVADELEGLGR